MGEYSFILSDGSKADELKLSLPDGSIVSVWASYFAELDGLRTMLTEAEKQLGFSLSSGRITDRLQSLIARHESVGAGLIRGAASVRDDMIVYLRAVAVIVSSITDDHLNHRQKNERLRGLLGVIEREIDSLRNERFDFQNTYWRRDRDLFAWHEPERRLRAENDRLRAELARLQGDKPDEETTSDDDQMPF